MGNVSYLVPDPATELQLDLLSRQPLNFSPGVERPIQALDFKLIVPAEADFSAMQVGATESFKVTVVLSNAPGLHLAANLSFKRESPDELHVVSVEGVHLTTVAAQSFLNLTIRPVDVSLTFGLDPWQLELRAKGEQKVLAELKIMGVTFELMELKLNAAGVVRARASARTQEVVAVDNFRNAKVLSAEATLAGDQCQAHIVLGFELDYFVGAQGQLDLLVSRGGADAPWQVAATTRINTNVTWTDPTGWLSFDRMGLSVEIDNQVPSTGNIGALQIKNLQVSGTVTFRAGALEGQAKQWLGKLFNGLSTDFRNVSLLNAGGSPSFSFGFEPLGGLRVRALDIFDLHIPKISFSAKSLTLGGLSLDLRMGEAVVQGRIGELNIDMIGQPALSMDSIDIALAMSAPGGVKASAKVRQRREATVEALEGVGQLSTPTFPGVKITFVLGRFIPEGSDRYEAFVVLYAMAPIDIPLFPGVVVRKLGIGVGVNAEVKNTSRLTLAKARQRLEEGLPDVSQPQAWAPTKTPLTLLARVFISPTKTPKLSTPELYVGDLTLIVTSDFQSAVLGKLWLQTSVEDAEKDAFQAKPSVVAMMLLDGQEPSLRVVAQTRSDGVSSIPANGIVGTLLGARMPETRLAFEATPSGLAVVVGPNLISGDLGPLKVSGSSLLAFRSSPNKTYAVARASLEARFGASSSVSFGLVSISASLRFGFAAQLLLLGYYGDLGDGQKLTVYGNAHVLAYVEINLHLRIGFRVRIGLPFGRSITISWSKDWDFDLQVHVDLQLELAISSHNGLGLLGQATVSVEVMGIRASLSIPVSAGESLINTGRSLQQAVDQDLKNLLGTS